MGVTMNIILSNISKQYDGLPVLNQVSLEFKEGMTTCLMGPSGVGKTTLLQILMGLVKADSGSLTGLKGKKLSAVFQENRLCESIDAIANIKMVCDKKTSIQRIRQELNEVGLTDYENKKTLLLSGGMKRRVAIVRAVLADSEVIFMDEPFKGLDEKLKEQVIQYVKRKTAGKTLIVVTHNKDEIKALSAELIVLKKDTEKF
jgi:NitT/TauT family transport system ATP-binding protein